MTHKAQAILKVNLKNYKTPTTKDAYERGFDRGYTCASWQNLPEVGERFWLDGEGRIEVDEDNQWDVVQSLAYEGESNDRQYSPFEFTSSEFNKARNSDARWEAFGAGISDGIAANIAERQSALALA
jgi:hypothetical protein